MVSDKGREWGPATALRRKKKGNVKTERNVESARGIEKAFFFFFLPLKSVRLRGSVIQLKHNLK